MTDRRAPATATPIATPLLAVACLSAFTANVDLSVVNLALPTLGRAFHAGQSELAWAVNAYVLPYAVSILAVGRLGDRFGHRRVLAGGAVLFLLGSVVGTLAPSLPVLLAGRVVQGVGGSALMTMGLAIVSANFEGADRARALGWLFASGAVAAVVGPLAGGVLTSSVGWQGMFWSQIPLAAFLAAGAIVALPRAGPRARRSLDTPGLALGSLFLLGVNVALLQAHAWGWASPAIAASWVAAVAALLLFVVRERTAAEPAVRLSVLGSRAFVGSALVGGAAWFGILSGSVQLSIYLQTTRGLDATGAALVFLPWPLVAALLFPRSGQIVARLGPERVMIGSLVIAAAAGAAMAGFDTATPLPIVSLVSAVGGVPIALGVTASTVIALSGFAPEEAGVASGVFNSLRQVGSSLGVAVPAAVFDLAVAGSPGDPLAGSAAAFASRAVVFAIVLALVVAILPRSRVAAPASQSQTAPAD